MKRKIAAFALVGVMAFGMLAGCGKKDSATNTKTATTASEARKAESSRKNFTVGFDASYPPYGYRDKNGEYTGFDLELAQKVADMEGWKLVKKPINWDSKDLMLNSGSIDCIWNGFTMTGREKSYTWSIPYVDNSQVIVVKKTSGIKSLSDLKGKVVGVQKASAALSVLQGDQKKIGSSFKSLKQFADYNVAFTELQADGLDALAIDSGVATYQVESRGKDKYSILSETLNKEQYAIGFKKGNTNLQSIINDDLKKLVKDGTFRKLAKKYKIENSVSLGK